MLVTSREREASNRITTTIPSIVRRVKPPVDLASVLNRVEISTAKSKIRAMNYGLSPHTKKALRLKVPAHLKIKSDMTVHIPKPNSVISDQQSNLPGSDSKYSTNLTSILNHQAKIKQNKRVEFSIDSPKMNHTMPVKAFRSVDAHRTPIA